MRCSRARSCSSACSGWRCRVPGRGGRLPRRRSMGESPRSGAQSGARLARRFGPKWAPGGRMPTPGHCTGAVLVLRWYCFGATLVARKRKSHSAGHGARESKHRSTTKSKSSCASHSRIHGAVDAARRTAGICVRRRRVQSLARVRPRLTSQARHAKHAPTMSRLSPPLCEASGRAAVALPLPPLCTVPEKALGAVAPPAGELAKEPAKPSKAAGGGGAAAGEPGLKAYFAEEYGGGARLGSFGACAQSLFARG